MNTYFPADPQTGANFDDTELQQVLAEIDLMLEKESYTDVIWCGDLNWDMSRNSAFAEIVKGFIDRKGLVPLWSLHRVDYTHIQTDNKTVSTLDHFIGIPHLVPLISKSEVVHQGDNMSHHSPIWLKLKIDVSLVVTAESP